jgi:DNA-binding XRE family transcriptional regulator
VPMRVSLPGFWQTTGIMERLHGRVSPLRRARLRSGLTQLELAARAGVSRQLIAAVEAGQNTPAVDAALRLAHALGTSVEALFSSAPASVIPVLDGPLPEGSPLRVGRVGGQLVAAELPDHGISGAGWARPDGILVNDELRLFEGATPAGLVLAGCDPALGVAEALLQGLGARSLLAVPTATGTALRALAAGTVHAAVVHGPADRPPTAPLPVLRLHLARWQVGIGDGSTPALGNLEALLGAGISFVQRDRAASSQQAFERAVLRTGLDAAPPGRLAAGHLDAARIAALLDCAAVTTEAAAHAFGLPFLGLEHHTVEIWVAKRWADHAAVEALGDVLRSAAFTARVAQFGGYELAGCGSCV